MGGCARKWCFAVIVAVTWSICLESGLRVLGQNVLISKYWNTNNLPFREGDINIVCLGESTTGGLWVDPMDSYPKKLERKLRSYFGNERIRVIVPPHVGQNSSQQANRISSYLDLFRPRLLILMSGANNEWALAESHITQFISLDSWQSLRLKFWISIDRFRLFKVIRYLYLRVSGGWIQFFSWGRNDLVIWGHPENVRWPPESETIVFAKSHHQAFLDLWRFDQETMVKAAQDRTIPVLFMTYPVLPGYLKEEEFRNLARGVRVPLVENHTSFDALRTQGVVDQYLFAQDQWHPNAKGYEVLSENAMKTIVDFDLLRLRK